MIVKLWNRYGKPLSGLRREQAVKTLLMFLYFFLTITVIYILKPVQRSLFISQYGAEKLAWAYMGEGPFLILVTSLYLAFARRVSKSFFYQGMLVFFASVLGLFWAGSFAPVPHLAAGFYLWHAALSITMTTVFWTLANDLFDTQEAKQLFGVILAGGSLGGIAGGALAKGLVRWVRTEDLILVAALAVVMCLGIVRILCLGYCRETPGASPTAPGAEGPSQAAEPTPAGSAVKIFLTEPYLLLLCGIVMSAKISAAITDNQLSVMAAQTLQGKEALTGFFGGFFAWLNAFSFLMQFFVTGVALRLMGVTASLYLLPLGLAALAGLNLWAPSLTAAILIRIFEGGTTVSVQQATKEVLYLPISSLTRRRIKPLIDMLGYRLAKSLGGVLIAFGLPLLGLAPNRVVLLLWGVVPFWAWMIWKLRRLYTAQLRHTAKPI